MMFMGIFTQLVGNNSAMHNFITFSLLASRQVMVV